jgi:hypothetical protein
MRSDPFRTLDDVDAIKPEAAAHELAGQVGPSSGRWHAPERAVQVAAVHRVAGARVEMARVVDAAAERRSARSFAAVSGDGRGPAVASA